MPNRTDVLNYLVERYNLNRYLEVGVQNPFQNFDKIRCPYKVSVDPDPRAAATFCMTSDEFFEKPDQEFDLVFIDGLHEAEQVSKDFTNAVRVLSRGGFIVLHDCNPLLEEHTIVPRPRKTGHWNGNCYKVAAAINQAIKHTVDVDNGCCVVQPDRSSFLFSAIHEIDWPLFDKHRKELLNLISFDDFKLQFAGTHFQ